MSGIRISPSLKQEIESLLEEIAGAITNNGKRLLKKDASTMLAHILSKNYIRYEIRIAVIDALEDGEEDGDKWMHYL